jgi:hypothetical protein
MDSASHCVEPQPCLRSVAKDLDPNEFLQPLAKANVKYWFNQVLQRPPESAYKAALKAFKTVSTMPHKYAFETNKCSRKFTLKNLMIEALMVKNLMVKRTASTRCSN